MSNTLDEKRLRPKRPVTRPPSTYRSVILIALIGATVVFLVWLPAEARTALWTALRVQRGLVSMLLLFALLALSLVWSVGERVDTWVFLLFNLRGYHPKWLDGVMWLVTQTGSMVAAFAAAIVFFVVRHRSLAAEIVLGTLTLWLVVETVKALTDRARPFLVLEVTRIIGRQERGLSFPSGHTSQIFFMATLLNHRFDLGLAGTAALYAVAVFVGFTRMYVGAHYPRDVIGGAVLGWVWGVLATLADPYWLGRF